MSKNSKQSDEVNCFIICTASGEKFVYWEDAIKKSSTNIGDGAYHGKLRTIIESSCKKKNSSTNIKSLKNCKCSSFIKY